MAMKKTYDTVNGQLIGEQTTGGSRIDYLTDALGNVTATVDQNANLINTYRYKPFGGVLAKTGSGADPSFQWVGSQGYRQTGKSYSDVYIRRRHYSSPLGRWTTQDPLGYRDDRNRYVYVQGRPTLSVAQRASLPGPAAIAMTIEVVGPPIKIDECGGAKFLVRWFLEQPRTGWLIQHVRFATNVYDCPLIGPANLIYHCHTHYWEAWQFTNSTVPVWRDTFWDDAGPYYNDKFEVYGYTPFENPFITYNSGTNAMSGRLRWYEGEELPPPQMGWVTGGDAGCGVTPGRLNWIGWLPGWIDPSSPPHGLHTGWHCCPTHPQGTQPMWAPRVTQRWAVEAFRP